MKRKLLGLLGISALCIQVGLAQQREITGTVVNEKDGTPAPGVAVIINGTSSGTVTDGNGSFTLKAEPDATLSFSFFGLVPKEVALAGRTELTVVMAEETLSIEDVVVVGYATQKKAHLTGAVTAISGQDISSKPSSDVLSAMQGKLPGVAVLRTSGEPGLEASGLRVRGFSSSNEASALVLIDGIEGSLTMLNPEDIESISVLKDAASASIYGSRAAAGVVLVTTKKGADTGRTRLSYSGSFGFNVPGSMPQRIPSWEEQAMINIARENDRGPGLVEQNPEATSWIGNPNYNYAPNGARWSQSGNTNWLAAGTRNYSTQQSHALTLSGGHGKTNYYLSGGFYTKGGMLKYGPNGYDRFNLRANLNTEVNKYMTLDVRMSYEGNLREDNTAGSARLLSTMYTARGRQLIYQPEEDTNYANSPYSSDLQINPIQIMKEGGIRSFREQYYTGSANLHVANVVKGLTLDLNASRRAGAYAEQSDYRYVPSYGRNGVPRGSYDYNSPSRVVKVKNSSYQDKLEALLNYDLQLNTHHFHVLAGASYEQYLKDEMSGTALNLLSEDLFSFNYYNSDVAANSILSDLVQPWKMASLFGRVNYDLAGRYLFEAVLRYDGSSRLDPNNRWGTFPSLSAAWRVSEEPFFKEIKPYVSNLKLRASWGQLGNSTVLNSMYYPYIGMISNKTENSTSTILSWMGNPVYYQKDMVSSGVTWETVQTTNVGLDVSLLKNRLDITADYYWKENDGMLAQVQVGHIAGAVNLPYKNAGVLKIWGWEVSAQWRGQIGELAYQIGASIEDSQNKLVSYEGRNTVRAGQVNLLEGHSLNTIWGYRTNGFWNSREEYLAYKEANPGFMQSEDAKISGGDVRYVAQGKADHQIGIGDGTPENPGDLVKLGDSNGRFLYGINLATQWKGFDLSMFWQGVGKRMFVVDPYTLAPLGRSYQMPWTIHRDYWREDNKDAYFARLVENKVFNYQPADRWVQNGAYVRLKNIQLGYTIPIRKDLVNSLRVYVQGTDVLEFTNCLKVFDPEVTPRSGENNGVTNQYYPFFRTWTVGVNLIF
jgi:TonB-linked SusC/RagA family outer membrane protein